MDSVRKARSRLANYPKLLAKCGDTASAYAKCVLQKETINKNDCNNEFQHFKNCLKKAAKDMATKL